MHSFRRVQELGGRSRRGQCPGQLQRDNAAFPHAGHDDPTRHCEYSAHRLSPDRPVKRVRQPVQRPRRLGKHPPAFRPPFVLIDSLIRCFWVGGFL